LLREALTVSQARHDARNGAEELISFTFSMLAIGGLSGSISAAYLTDADDLHHCFLLPAFFGLLLLLASLRMSSEGER